MTTRPGYVWDATASEWVEIGQAAVVAPVAYQTSAPSSPATGDIWIDSDDEVPSVDSTLYYRWTKTMSGGETSLSGTDNNSLALKYTPGYESVFINGVLQVRGSDYVATTGTTVTGLTALTANDVVMVESIIAYSVGDTYTQTTLDGKFSPITTTGAVLIASQTIGTAVSSVTFSNAFSATYDAYKILISGVTFSSTGVNLTMVFNNSSGNFYYYGGQYQEYTGGITAQSGNGVASFVIALTGSSSTTNSNIDVFNPFLATATGYISQSASSTYSTRHAGYNSTTTSQTGFTLTPASGTITGGTIKIYGYK